jgi:hypothetical protein
LGGDGSIGLAGDISIFLDAVMDFGGETFVYFDGDI